MLTSLVERLQTKRVPRDESRYRAWSTALQKLHNDGRREKLPAIGSLPHYLKDVPQDQRAHAIEDLVAAHLHWSWQAGEGQKLESYLKAIPSAKSLNDVPFELIEDELLARYQRPHGDFPSLSSYQQRLPSRPQVAEKLRERCLDGERYVKLHRIGVGAVAVVWEAFDRSACREVAIKEPLQIPDSDSSSDKPHPFSVEASMTRSFDHPGIVGMVEVAPNDGSPTFFVMRLVGTTTLSDKIEEQHAKLTKQSKPLAFQEGLRDLLEAVTRVCDAIDYAHQRGILHCDLKPENVACNDHGDIGVIDWGLAVEINNADGSNRAAAPRRLAGTPHYMAPEQMDGIIDVRTEVFGLGAILYETLTAQPPYSWLEGGVEVRPDDWPEMVRLGKFLRPRKVRRTIPKPLEEICLKAMAVNPQDRHSSAAALAEHLRSYLGKADRRPFR